MSLDNLGDLQAAIADWLYRTGDTALAARASDFIALFESDFLIDPDMRAAEMQEISTATIAGGSTPLPPDFIDMVRLQVIGLPNGTPNQVLDYVSPRQAAVMDSISMAPAAGQQLVQNYTVLAGQIFLTPQRWAPVGATLELTYNSFTPLSEAEAGANWLLAKYPNLYLYGSLMQAAAYVNDNVTVAKWKSGRDEAMAKFPRSESKRMTGGAPLSITNSIGFVR